MVRSGRRQVAFWLLAVALSVAAAAATAEIVLRLAGHKPWRFRQIGREPTMNEPDSVLGWRNRPGDYRYPAYTEGLPDISITILRDHSRKTGPEPAPARPVALLLGGSFTHGLAVSDEETFAWKLQRSVSRYRWVNLGTAGYGTYQSLLALERWYAAGHTASRVIYGFIAHHEDRNVAPNAWIRALATAQRRRLSAVPWVSIGSDGRLERHPPDGYRLWPGSGRSALIAGLQDRLEALARRSRTERKREIAFRLLDEMMALCRRNGAALTVVALSAPAPVQTAYASHLARHGVALVDCDHELTPELRVPDEGHPNGRLHTLWADCIEQALAPELQPAVAPEPPRGLR